MDDVIDAECVAAALRGAVESLGRRRDAINDLNVFPVPDGDTGTNLLLTVEAALAALEGRAGGAGALEAAAHGALMGSRGNSGIILSQLIAGLASPAAPAGTDIVNLLMGGLAEGVRLAYASVREPVEGTMLTVAREVSEGLAAIGPGSAEELLQAAYRLACESLERTPMMLDALADAGVVDAGGAGLVAMLEGLPGVVHDGAEAFDWEARAAAPRAVVYDGPGAGIVFFVGCPPGELEYLGKELEGMGDSLLIAGTAPPYRVHIHTDHPGLVIDTASRYGDVTGTRTADFSGLGLAETGGGRGRARTAVLAFSVSGELGEAFTAMGAQVVNPAAGGSFSTGELVEAARATGAHTVIIVPNDPDVLKVALMAARVGGPGVRVVNVASPVQGLAAMEECVDCEDAERTMERMEARGARVRVGHVARAGRSARVGGLEVTAGQFVGFADGGACFAGEDIDEAARSVCGHLLDGGCSTLTVVERSGAGIDRAALDRFVSRRTPAPGVEWFGADRLRYEFIAGAG